MVTKIRLIQDIFDDMENDVNIFSKNVKALNNDDFKILVKSFLYKQDTRASRLLSKYFKGDTLTNFLDVYALQQQAGLELLETEAKKRGLLWKK